MRRLTLVHSAQEAGSVDAARLAAPARPPRRQPAPAPAVNVEDRINAGRSLFPRMWFDETNCADGLDALSNYRREWKDKLMQLNAAPLHDWSSHGADAYGEIALTEQQTGAAKPKKPDLSKRLGGSGWA